MIEQTLNQRQTTHGSFLLNAVTSQNLKTMLRKGENYTQLSNAQKESLDMIAHKMARIVNGNPNEPDHWLDIIGYATLVHEELI